MRNLKGHIPIRTCVSCRTKMAKMDLIRLVLNGKDQIVFDSDGKRKGRGIYICHKESCMKKLSARRNLNRLFRVERPVSIGF
ncbi:YlxR family protein [Thermodesulfobacteriota bacterium]